MRILVDLQNYRFRIIVVVQFQDETRHTARQWQLTARQDIILLLQGMPVVMFGYDMLTLSS